MCLWDTVQTCPLCRYFLEKVILANLFFLSYKHSSLKPTLESKDACKNILQTFFFQLLFLIKTDMSGCVLVKPQSLYNQFTRKSMSQTETPSVKITRYFKHLAKVHHQLGFYLPYNLVLVYSVINTLWIFGWACGTLCCCSFMRWQLADYILYIKKAKTKWQKTNKQKPIKDLNFHLDGIWTNNEQIYVSCIYRQISELTITLLVSLVC